MQGKSEREEEEDKEDGGGGEKLNVQNRRAVKCASHCPFSGVAWCFTPSGDVSVSVNRPLCSSQHCQTSHQPTSLCYYQEKKKTIGKRKSVESISPKGCHQVVSNQCTNILQQWKNKQMETWTNSWTKHELNFLFCFDLFCFLRSTNNIIKMSLHKKTYKMTIRVLFSTPSFECWWMDVSDCRLRSKHQCSDWSFVKSFAY